MTATIKVDAGIPIPIPRAIYPFRTMKIGDSFLWDGDAGVIRTAAATFKRRNPSFNYATRKVDGGTRIWRIK